jgi:hypothetical protein
MTFEELKATVAEEHGFDVTPATVEKWINERYATLVVRAQWRLAEYDLGQTVAAQPDYEIDSDVQDLAYIYVGDSDPWLQVAPREMRRLQTGTDWLEGEPGAFAPAYSGDGNTAYLRLYPTPDTADLSIVGFAALPPAPLVNDTDEPIVPADFHLAIAYGAIGVGLKLDAETLQQASYFDTFFESEVERLRRRRISRIGSGPTRMRIGR